MLTSPEVRNSSLTAGTYIDVDIAHVSLISVFIHESYVSLSFMCHTSLIISLENVSVCYNHIRVKVARNEACFVC